MRKKRGNAKPGRKRSTVKDLSARKADRARGGVSSAPGKVTFGAPSTRPVAVDPSDPSGNT
jgi:hypothetical protein